MSSEQEKDEHTPGPEKKSSITLFGWIGIAILCIVVIIVIIIIFKKPSFKPVVTLHPENYYPQRSDLTSNEYNAQINLGDLLENYHGNEYKGVVTSKFRKYH
jgi:flagellar basal body-associated protein FliL